VKERLEALIALEIALLVSLCSPNPDICLDSIRCLGYLCDEAEYGNDDEDPQLTEITYICNLPIYFDLASEGSVFLGRKAQQKRIRKYLRMMTQPTPGNLAAWEEGYKRWKALMKHIRHLDNNTLDMTNSKSPVLAKEQHFLRKRLDLDEDKPTEWQNYTGFLASLGVCCLTDDTELATMDNGERFSNMTMYNVANTNTSNRRLSSPSEPSRMIDRFMAETTDLLVSDNVFIRESVKDSLGNDLSTALYAILFHHLTSMTTKLFANEKPITGKTNTLFVEQAILVLKLILDRLVDPNDCLMNIEFGSFILQFTRYVDVLSDNYVTLRVKIKLCTLVETCLSKKEQIVIGNETRLRNKLLGVLRDWTSNDTQAAISASQNDTLRRDLDQACLKTMVQLLHRLPLQPLEPVRTTDALQTKSKLFYGYFDFFLRVLARCGHPEVMCQLFVN
jgi:neurofibromin 1